METFINNNTSLDCLNSRDAVLHARLNLPESMLRCSANLVLTFPKLDSLQCPQLSITPDHQELKVLIGIITLLQLLLVVGQLDHRIFPLLFNQVQILL